MSETVQLALDQGVYMTAMKMDAPEAPSRRACWGWSEASLQILFSCRHCNAVGVAAWPKGLPFLGWPTFID